MIDKTNLFKPVFALIICLSLILTSASAAAAQTENTNKISHGLPETAYSASSSNSGQEAKYAFDGNADTVWQAPLQWQNSQWIMIDFGKPENISRVDFFQYNNRTKLFRLQYSDDMLDWNDAFTGAVDSASDEGGSIKYQIVFDIVRGRYLRLYFTETAPDSTGAQTQPAIFEMEAYSSKGNATTSAQIRKVSSDLTVGLPDGAFSSTASYEGQEAKYAFGNRDGNWQPLNAASADSPQWLSADMGKEQNISRIELCQYNNRIKQFSIQISDDGVKWDNAFKGTVPSASDSGAVIYYTVVFPTVRARYIRVNIEESVYTPILYDVIILSDSKGKITSEKISQNIIVKAKEISHGLPSENYTASNFNPDQGPKCAFDELDWSVWQAPDQYIKPQWIKVDFKTEKTVSAVEFIQYNNRAKLFKLQVSDDNLIWNDAFYGKVCNAADSGGNIKYTVAFAPVKGRYFRFLFEETAADSSGTQTMPALFDLRIYDKKGEFTTSAQISEIKNISGNCDVFLSNSDDSLNNNALNLTDGALTSSAAVNYFENSFGCAEIIFDSIKKFNRADIIFPTDDYTVRPEDIAVDVRLSDGLYRRVAELHNINHDGINSLSVTFEETEAVSIRFTANAKRSQSDKFVIAEIKVLQVPENIYFTGMQPLDSQEYSIPLITAADINGDLSTDSADLILIKKYLINAEENKIIDINGDGRSDIIDLVFAKKILINL